MSNNKVSAKEYWLDRIDEVFVEKRSRLIDEHPNEMGSEHLTEAAIRSLGIQRLMSQRQAARQKVVDANKAVEKIEAEIGKKLGIEGRSCYYFDGALDSRIKSEAERCEKRIYQRSEAGRELLKLSDVKKELRDRVMSARRPSDYDGIENDLGQLGDKS